MTSFVVTLLAALLAQPNAAEQKSTAQPCSAQTLTGTWQLVKSGGDPAGGATALKHVTPTHFFVLSVDATGLAAYGHGGPYTVSGDKYTETIAHGFGDPFSQLRGMSVSFQCSLDGDVWHTVGQIGDQTFDERWKRVPAAAAK